MGEITTQEKIAVMQAFVDNKQIQEQPFKQGPYEDRETEPPWNWGTDNYRVKPEPLEWWFNIYPEKVYRKDRTAADRYDRYGSEESARKAANETVERSVSVIRVAVHMREVTDEE